MTMLRLSGADAVMIGRGAVGRPWFVGEVARHLAGDPRRRPLDAATRYAVALEHYRTLLGLMGKEHGTAPCAQTSRRLTPLMCRGPDAAHLRRRLVTSENPEEVESLLEVLFESEERGGRSMSVKRSAQSARGRRDPQKARRSFSRCRRNF